MPAVPRKLLIIRTGQRPVPTGLNEYMYGQLSSAGRMDNNIKCLS